MVAASPVDASSSFWRIMKGTLNCVRCISPAPVSDSPVGTTDGPLVECDQLDQRQSRVPRSKRATGPCTPSPRFLGDSEISFTIPPVVELELDSKEENDRFVLRKRAPSPPLTIEGVDEPLIYDPQSGVAKTASRNFIVKTARANFFTPVEAFVNERDFYFHEGMTMPDIVGNVRQLGLGNSLDNDNTLVIEVPCVNTIASLRLNPVSHKADNRGIITPERLARMIARLLSMIKAIHDTGFIHRKISTKSILVGEKVEDTRIIGFGNAGPYINFITGKHVVPGQEISPISRRTDMIALVNVILSVTREDTLFIVSTHKEEQRGLADTGIINAVNNLMHEMERLKFNQTPDYLKWIELFSIMAKSGTTL